MASESLAEFARGYASLVHQGARDAFLDTMRSVIGPDGQKVSALDRLYLADQIPFLLIWGNEDPVIPVGVAAAAGVGPLDALDLAVAVAHGVEALVRSTPTQPPES